MEYLSASQKIINTIKRESMRGISISSALKMYISEEEDIQIKRELHNLLSQKKDFLASAMITSNINSHRLALYHLILRGIEGQSVLQHLVLLEKEIDAEISKEMDKYLQKLPFKALIPLLFFIFPAFMILLIGPILVDFLNGFG